MKRTENISDINKSKYLYPPSWNQIEEFINELGVKMYHFEKFYHIPFNTLTQIKSGSRQLPSDYWDIIYERIKPTYGAGFLDEYTHKQHKKRINNGLTANLTNSIPQTITTNDDNHDRTGTLT